MNRKKTRFSRKANSEEDYLEVIRYKMRILFGKGGERLGFRGNLVLCVERGGFSKIEK